MTESRLFKILYYLLDKGHATAPELASAFEVSARTIYRDIDVLSGTGIPIYAEPGRNGGIRLLQDSVLDRTLLSEKEKQEILIAIQSMAATGYTAGEDTLTKLSSLFHISTTDWLEVDFSRWGKNTGDNIRFETLKRAVIEHRETEITYENTKSETGKRIVQPLKLFYKSKEWYLKAFCLQKQDFRLFKLNRILDLKVTTQTFVPKPYPGPEKGPQQTYPRIVLLFSKEIAYRVYDEFDVSQTERQENGDILACAEMPVDAWLVGYLLSFGSQVEVIEPACLRKTLADRALEIHQKYQQAHRKN